MTGLMCKLVFESSEQLKIQEVIIDGMLFIIAQMIKRRVGQVNGVPLAIGGGLGELISHLQAGGLKSVILLLLRQVSVVQSQNSRSLMLNRALIDLLHSCCA